MDVIKLFLFGNFNSGKTQFIKSISEIEVVSLEMSSPIPDEGTTLRLGLDFGRFTVDESLVVHLFGQPGNIWVSTILKVVPPSQLNVDGCLFMVDSDRHLHLREAKSELQKALTVNKPFMVIANYQDRLESLSPNQIREELQVPDDIPVLPCIATDSRYVKRILLELCKLLPESRSVNHLRETLATDEVLELNLDHHNAKRGMQFGSFGIFTTGQSNFSEIVGDLGKGDSYLFRSKQSKCDTAALRIGGSIKLYLIGGTVFAADTLMNDIDFYGAKYREILSGYVFLIDSPFSNEEKTVIQKFLANTQKPCAVVLHNQSQSKAMTPDQFRKRLNLSPEISILTCDTVDKEVMKQVILSLYKLSPHDDTLKRLAAKLST